MKDKILRFSWFAVILLVISQGGFELITLVAVSGVVSSIAYKIISIKTGLKDLQTKKELSAYERWELQDKEELAIIISILVFFVTFIFMVVTLAVTY